MKKLISLVVFGAVSALGLFAQLSSQSAPGFTVGSGTASYTTRPCTDLTNVGSIYTQYANPSITYVCSQTGATVNGLNNGGAFGWTAIQLAGSGGGTVNVAAGKTFTVNNSLTLAGTDSTTQTFPTTSATIARTDAGQTFTGVQTFSSAPVIASITNTGTETLPTNTGGMPIVIACGSTTGTAACGNTAVGATAQIYYGHATLASNTATITFTPGYTSSSSFYCTANDVTTRANPVQAVPASASTMTITNTTGAADVIQYICVGN